MQLTVFNGSPRGRKSNSKIILDQFLEGFVSNPKNSYELCYLNRLNDTENFVRAFAEAETVLLAHPLYTDAMPAIVKAFIEELEPLSGQAGNPTLGLIIQSGFVSAAHSRYVERYWEKFSRRLGSRYLGTVIKGGCEPLLRGEKQFKKILEGFHDLGIDFGETGQFNQKMVAELTKPEKIPTLMRMIIQLVWRVAGNGYFDEWLKENGAYERSFAQPYVDRTL